MSVYIQNFLKFRPLLEELISRDVKIKYRRSVLGVLWTLLNPLLMMTVLSVVFSSLFRLDVENFPLYLLSGQVVFNFFNEATTNAMSAIIGNSSLIKKVYVPKYVFVLSRIASSFINFLAACSALFMVMIVTRAELHFTMLLAVIPVLLMLLLTLGVGLVLAAITVKFRDVMHLYSVLMTMLLYLTPVIYPLSILPDWLHKLVLLNPLTGIITMFRDVVLYHTMINAGTLGIAVVEIAAILVIGIYVFYKNQDAFILHL